MPLPTLLHCFIAKLLKNNETISERRRAKQFNNGLTLVELQIAMAIGAGIALLVGGVYFTYTRMFNEERVGLHVASENKIAIDELTNQIRESPGVSTNCTICSGQTTSSSTVLILKIWPLGATGETFEPTNGEYDYIVYRLSGVSPNQNLIKEIFPNGTSSHRINTSKILSTNVKTLLFEYDSPSDLSNSTTVTTTLTNEEKSFVKTHTISQSAKSVLRNR